MLRFCDLNQLGFFFIVVRFEIGFLSLRVFLFCSSQIFVFLAHLLLG
ncbi:hypothetical protein SLEP1_g31214 [Rubroshorea leprosula]|uniref:Uncharacterized protein n=1 Tax=Rubroshorea leprosula TaxID=152421 RepID=A0AAV5KA41_9ROSI|nr:hypothetical protein SLEP1_g31214 [Rubroshorea leprosula]